MIKLEEAGKRWITLRLKCSTTLVPSGEERVERAAFAGWREMKSCFAACLRVLSRSFRWPTEMDSLETIFLKGLIRRLLQYSIIAPEINFARRCHLISLDFQEKIFLDCNRIILFICIEHKYLQCGESWRCHGFFFVVVFLYRFLHQFLNGCLSGSVFVVVVVFYESAPEYCPRKISLSWR